MELKTYFFDTYAFHEVISGNPDYEKFSKKIAIVTTKLNLMELYYTLLLKYNLSIADKYYEEFLKYAVETDDDTIKSAMQFKIKNKKMSYADCIGYFVAKKRNARFLTGDEHFRELPNVEFVK